MAFDNIDKSREVSEFNEAVNQIMRLNYLWNSIARYREGGKLQQARWKLDTAELELKHDAKKVDRDKNTNYVTQLVKINNAIKVVDIKVNKLIKGKEVDEGYIRRLYGAFLYNLLINKETLLREIQEEAGKGGKYKSSDDDELD